ncbi:MAG: hypothetical protein JO048_04925 [Methylobacteriaceae bacterium]|nr:hypothetical protein [Methylobacteriaceae bacterium]
MTGSAGHGRPPAATRFRKGESGNPKGRPKAGPRTSPSAFDVIIDRTFTVRQNGKDRELTVEEALQHRTYQDAIAGNRAARREVLKMIEKREKWLAGRSTTRHAVAVLSEPTDPRNADGALLLLGIAEPDTKFAGVADPYDRLLLEPWAVQAALRRRRRRLSEKEIAAVKLCTRDSQSLVWPAETSDE